MVCHRLSSAGICSIQYRIRCTYRHLSRLSHFVHTRAHGYIYENFIYANVAEVDPVCFFLSILSLQIRNIYF